MVILVHGKSGDEETRRGYIMKQVGEVVTSINMDFHVEEGIELEIQF